MSEPQAVETSQVDSDASELNEVEQDEYEDENEVTDESAEEQSDEDQAPEPEDDSEEIEFNGQAHKLPKTIAEAVRGMQKDYTVKTQAVAEQRKQFEAQVQFQQQHIQEVAQVHALTSQLEEFKKLDWNGLSAEDPVRAQQLFFYQKQLEDQRNALAQTITQKNQQSALDKQQEIAKRIEESESVLKREINWNPELEAKLATFAASNYGIDPNDFKDAKQNPQVMKLLNDAYVGKQLIQKQTAKPKIVQAQPVTTLSTRGIKSQPDPSKMSQAEYSKWRKKGYQ